MIANGLPHGRCGRNAGHSLLSLRAGKGRQAVCSPPPTIVSSSAQGILIDPLTADVPCSAGIGNISRTASTVLKARDENGRESDDLRLFLPTVC